jgi:hypothetical protein
MKEQEILDQLIPPPIFFLWFSILSVNEKKDLSSNIWKKNHQSRLTYRIFFQIRRFSTVPWSTQVWSSGAMTRHYPQYSGNKFPVLSLTLKQRPKRIPQEYGVGKSSVYQILPNLPTKVVFQKERHSMHYTVFNLLSTSPT